MIRQVNYDTIAGEYGRRYERHEYHGVRQAVVEFVASAAAASVLEVGCGTGHWLAELATIGARVAGVDLSRGMLLHARDVAIHSILLQGRAEQLPYASATFDRVICINALHHLVDGATFFREAIRVIRPGGGLLVIGMDPHVGTDQWWIYDLFPEAIQADRRRYPPAKQIHADMVEAGFTRCSTREVQRFAADITVAEAAARDYLERTSTSQLMVISDEEYERGCSAFRAAEPKKTLRTDLRLYATVGWGDPIAARSGT
jgi:ubiquinone/menaquinone biosynthesis C-methylase UbiE